MKTNEQFKHNEISSQNQLLYKVLKAGVKVDRFSFKKLCRDYGIIECERLAARINDIKHRLADDEIIESVIVYEGKTKHAEYFLKKVAVNKNDDRLEKYWAYYKPESE